MCNERAAVDEAVLQNGFAPFVNASLGATVGLEQADRYERLYELESIIDAFDGGGRNEMLERSRTDFSGAVTAFLDEYTKACADMFKELQRISDMVGYDSFVDYYLEEKMGGKITCEQLEQSAAFTIESMREVYPFLSRAYNNALFETDFFEGMSNRDIEELTCRLLCEVNPAEQESIDFLGRNDAIGFFDGEIITDEVGITAVYVAARESAEELLCAEDYKYLMNLILKENTANTECLYLYSHEHGHAYSLYSGGEAAYMDRTYSEVYSTANTMLLLAYMSTLDEYTSGELNDIVGSLYGKELSKYFPHSVTTRLFVDCMEYGGEITADDVLDVLAKICDDYGLMLYNTDSPSKEKLFKALSAVVYGYDFTFNQIKNELTYTRAAPASMYLFLTAMDDIEEGTALYNRYVTEEGCIKEITDMLIYDETGVYTDRLKELMLEMFYRE